MFHRAHGLLAPLLVLVAGCGQPPAPASMKGVSHWEITSLEGDGAPQVIQLAPETRAIVFEFLSTECPIANRAQPELNQLAQKFGPQGVRFVAVYPNVSETADGIRQHRAEALFSGEAGRDPQQKLARQLEVTVTPEVVVLAADGALIYRGRVNDQYAGLGQGKPAPTRHDLAEALQDFLASGLASGVHTPPVGCRVQPVL